MALAARGRARRGTPISLLTAAAAVVAALAAVEAAKPPIEAAVALNVKRVLHRTGDFFLGLQVDPVELLDAHGHRWDSARALTLAKGLAPAYLRVAGPGTDSVLLSSAGNTLPNNITEADWLLLTRFCAAGGLRPAVAVSAAARLAGAWDPRPALPLLGLAASLGCDLTLQLGFEPQESPYLQPSSSGASLAGVASVASAAAAAGAAAGAQAGRDAAALRRLLDAFPQCASRARMLAPAVTRVRAPQDVAFVRAALDAAAPVAATAVVWLPGMWEPAEGAPGGALGPKARPRPLDQLLAERDALLRMIPRTATSRHSPLWIGEPWSEVSGAERGGVDEWEAALRWARRLGVSARLGAAVALHSLPAHALLDPPPDYWVSLLHRRLAGDGVFEARVAGGGRRLDVFCRCAARSPGALLVMAVNGARGRVRLAVKGLPSAVAAHAAGSPAAGSPAAAALQYVLTHREGETLLNGRPLRLPSNDSLPALEPRALPPPPPPPPGAHPHPHGAQPLTLSVPPRAVAFWVLPGAGVRLCAPPTAAAMALLGRVDDHEAEEENEEEGEGEGEEEEEEEDAEVLEVDGGRRRRLGGGLHALQRLRAAPEGVSAGDYEDQDDDYDYYNDDPDPAQARPAARGGAGAGEGAQGSALVGQSAEAVWSIAQATLLSDRRATVGVAGGSGGDGDDDEEPPTQHEGAAPTDEDPAPPDMPAPLPKEREKYLKNMFVNAITKGPDAQERSRRMRRAVPGAPGPAFVLAAAPPPLPGARKTLAKPWKREREDLAERRPGRPPRRGTKARDPDEEKIEAIFGQPLIDLEAASGSKDPVETFPVGDVFLEEGKADTSMDRNKDYDYVQEDSEELQQMRRRARGRGRGRRRRPAGGRSPGGDNRIIEYKHSELFEELGVTHAPKDATPPPPCTHELQEAAALRELPPAPGPQTNKDPTRGATDSAVAGGDSSSTIIEIETKIVEGVSPSQIIVREEEEMVKQGRRVSKNIRKHEMNSYTHSSKASEETDEYGDTGEMSSDYDSLMDSLNFEEAIARRHRSQDDDEWVSDLDSCEAPDWPMHVHDKFPTCNV